MLNSMANSSLLSRFTSVRPLLTLTPACSRCSAFLQGIAQRNESTKSAGVRDSVLTVKKEPHLKSYDPPSPYKNPGPRRYGYEVKYKTEGTLPRDNKPVLSLRPFRAEDKWTKQKALFGQNDYIDILGDGELHPSDLLTGPKWLLAFKGNERERLMRKMEWQGDSLRTFYPTEYNRMQKRIRYLTKLYNTKRCRRRWD